MAGVQAGGPGGEVSHSAMLMSQIPCYHGHRVRILYAGLCSPPVCAWPTNVVALLVEVRGSGQATREGRTCVPGLCVGPWDICMPLGKCLLQIQDIVRKRQLLTIFREGKDGQQDVDVAILQALLKGEGQGE